MSDGINYEELEALTPKPPVDLAEVEALLKTVIQSFEETRQGFDDFGSTWAPKPILNLAPVVRLTKVLPDLLAELKELRNWYHLYSGDLTSTTLELDRQKERADDLDAELNLTLAVLADMGVDVNKEFRLRVMEVLQKINEAKAAYEVSQKVVREGEANNG